VTLLREALRKIPLRGTAFTAEGAIEASLREVLRTAFDGMNSVTDSSPLVAGLSPIDDLRDIFVRTRLKNPSFVGTDKEDVEASLRLVLFVLVVIEDWRENIGVDVEASFGSSSSLETTSFKDALRLIFLLGLFVIIPSLDVGTEVLLAGGLGRTR